MKILLKLLALFSTVTIFYSCNSDTPITPPGPDGTGGYKWSVVTTTNGEIIGKLAACDENTVIGTGYLVGYKISSGVLSTFSFNDSLFASDNLAAYNANYYAYSGTQYTPTWGKKVIKIFENGTMTNVTLDTHSTAEIKNIVILEPGKIAAVTSSVLYMYNNGNVSAYASPDSFSTGFNFITVQGSALYISGSRKIYKFENNAFSIVNTESGTVEYVRMKVNNTILKAPFSTLSPTVSYWSGTDWTPLFTDASRKVYIRASGESTNHIYFLTLDSSFTKSYGKIWTGTQLIDDNNYPQDNPETNLYTMDVSNMRGNVVFLSKRQNYTSKIYRGVKNF